MRYQEEIWRGKLGDDYTEDNNREKFIQTKSDIFKDILNNELGIKSILEYGANIGLNIPGVLACCPKAKFYGVEINKSAYDILKSRCTAFHQSIFDKLNLKADLVLTYGLLIHIDPNDLDLAYKILYEHSKKYILLIEHCCKIPFTAIYRGANDVFFKNNFINDIVKKYNLKMVRYGKVRGDLYWALLSKF